LTPYLPQDNFGFQPVINKLLAKNPQQRFQNGLKLVDALNEYDAKLGDVSEMDFSHSVDVKRVQEEITSSTQRKAQFQIPELQFELKNESDGAHTEKNDFGIKQVFSIEHLISNRKYQISSVLFITLMMSLVFFIPGQEDAKKIDNVIFSGQDSELTVVTPPLLSLSDISPSNTAIAEPLLSELELRDKVAALQNSGLDKSKISKSTEDTVVAIPAPELLQAVTQIKHEETYAQPPIILKADVENAKQSALEISEKIEILQARAEAYMKQLKFTMPKGNNAYTTYIAIQDLDPENRQAREGIANIAEGYAYMAKLQINKQNFEKATQYIQKGLTVQEDNEWLIMLQLDVNEWLHIRRTKPLGSGAEAVAFD
ncbi:MAG: hypothetical protein OEM38_07285, partial [Gammaproteobacteria bacterium]|nr:hypothetical protein [Gammaproteobacteria bacterium]